MHMDVLFSVGIKRVCWLSYFHYTNSIFVIRKLSKNTNDKVKKF